MQESKSPRLIFYKGTGEYYLDLSEILFFETEGNKIYAHTQKDAYEVRLKLYELESILPRYFSRVSKSTIANIRQVYSVDKSFSGTGTISFYQTHKEVHVSRHYQSLLKENLLLQGNFGIPSFGGQIWPLLGIAFFAYQSVGALLRRHLTSASFTALVALMIANHFYGILPIPNQSLFWASILIVMGVSALTHSNRTWNGKKWWYDGLGLSTSKIKNW